LTLEDCAPSQRKCQGADGAAPSSELSLAGGFLATMLTGPYNATVFPATGMA